MLSATLSATAAASGTAQPSPTATHTSEPCPYGGDSRYTDPALGICGDPASNCAWGSGGGCVPCPKGAVCPGGALICPRAGFWLPASSADPATLVQCTGEDALTRCPEYANATLPCVAADAFTCGEGYQTGTVACGGCAPRYFQLSTSACSRCATTNLFQDVVLPVVTILLAAVCVVSVFAGVAFCCARKYGGTPLGSLQRSAALLVWMLTALQMLVTIGRSVPASAPSVVQSLFAGLSKLQFQGVVLSPACTPGIVPFSAQWAQFSTVLVAYALVLLAVAAKRAMARCCAQPPAEAPPCRARCASCVERGVIVPLFFSARAALALLCLAYAMFTLTALAMITCESRVMAVGGYLSLAQDGSTLLAAARRGDIPGDVTAIVQGTSEDASVFLSSLAAIVKGAADGRTLANSSAILSASLTVSVLSSDVFTVCYEGAHAAIWRAAVSVIALYAVLFPLASGVAVWAIVDARMRDDGVVSPDAAAQWRTLRAAWLLDQVRCASHARPRCCAALSAWAPGTRAQRARVVEAHALIDASPDASDGGALSLISPWTVGGARPSFFYFKQLNEAVLLIISTPIVLYAQTNSYSAGKKVEVAGLAVSLIATLGAATLVARTQPYPRAFTWKAHAETYIYALVALSTVANFTAFMSTHEPSPSPALVSAAAALSLTVVAATVVLFACLVAFFLLSLRAEALAEELRLHVTAASARFGRTRRKSATAGALIEQLRAGSPRSFTYGGGYDDPTPSHDAAAAAVAAALAHSARATATHSTPLHDAVAAAKAGLFSLGLLAASDVSSERPSAPAAGAPPPEALAVVHSNPLAASQGASDGSPAALLTSRRASFAGGALGPHGVAGGSARELSRATAVRRQNAAFRSMDARAMRSLHARASLQQRSAADAEPPDSSPPPPEPLPQLSLAQPPQPVPTAPAATATADVPWGGWVVQSRGQLGPPPPHATSPRLAPRLASPALLGPEELREMRRSALVLSVRGDAADAPPRGLSDVLVGVLVDARSLPP